MKKASRILGAFTFLSIMMAMFCSIPVSASTFDVPPLLMTEFTMNPKGVDFQGEYVEIYNCSSEAIDLKDYKLAYTYSTATVTILFNEITKYAKSDITINGKVEPEKAMLEPGEAGVIWIKGNAGTSNASEKTTDDFLNSYMKSSDEVNMFIAEHVVSGTSEFVNGGNFYMVNHSSIETVINLYLVRKEAIVENYQDHIITGFESKVEAFKTDAYVHLQFDETTGLTKVLEIYTGDRIMAYEWLGEIMPEQDPFFDPSTTTSPPETTPAPVTTPVPVVTTSAPITTPAPTTDTVTPDDDVTTVSLDTTAGGQKSCKSSLSFGILTLLIPAFVIIRKKKV